MDCIWHYESIICADDAPRSPQVPRRFDICRRRYKAHWYSSDNMTYFYNIAESVVSSGRTLGIVI